eukprot:501422-Pelagomonas_calceolata.AAC.2
MPPRRPATYLTASPGATPPTSKSPASVQAHAAQPRAGPTPPITICGSSSSKRPLQAQAAPSKGVLAKAEGPCSRSSSRVGLFSL